MSDWKPPHDDCRSCRFYRPRPTGVVRTLCQLCGVGEFYEPRIDTSPPTDEELMGIYRAMFEDGQVPDKNDIDAISDKDDDGYDEPLDRD